MGQGLNREMKRILITGANSCIGDSVKEYLEQWPGQYTVSVKDTVNWEPKVSDFKGYDCVFHVAGIVHRRETKKNAHLYYEINRDLSIEVAKAAKDAGVGQMILMSTMSVYGMITGYITKQTKPDPRSHYGKSKLQADRVIWKMRSEVFRVAVLRPPMVYGKGCKGNYQGLRFFALKFPVFPEIDNQRSMLYIGNLCWFAKDVIDKRKQGLFFPQNEVYVNTSCMVEAIAKENRKKIRLTKAFNLGIGLMRVNIVKKVFGSLTYEKVDLVSEYGFRDSIYLTEGNINYSKNKQVVKDDPLVTILTVSYNAEKTISRTIEAVLNQTYSNIEYIIIDGVSTDTTADIARSYQEVFDRTQGRSLLVVSEPDKGMYDALNKGARLAHGVILGQTNADDWYELDAVETMVRLFQNKHYDLAWGNIRVHKPSGTVIKKAKVDILWTTSGWCHPAAFSRREVLLGNPYILESMYDDFDYMTSLRKQRKIVITVDHLISNFSFGGMSTQKKLSDVKKRANARYKVYRRFRFPRAYKVHCYVIELVKYMMG